MQKPEAIIPDRTNQQSAPQPAIKMQAPQEAPQPVTNALKPDTTVTVPTYMVCLAKDATVTEDAVRAIATGGKKEGN